MELPSYTSTLINAPPTYDEITYTESVWPRNYERSTPRINLAQFYHQVVLNSQLSQINNNDDDQEEDDEDENNNRDMKSSNEANNNNNNNSIMVKSSHSVPLSYEHPHQHSISELNRILIQSWSHATSIPSYTSFKNKVKRLNLIPIPNSKYHRSS
ncbi:hypothetical protein BJ944DRAFT_265509 [Cunninghamella echinulata]|nr:hypothetical protein BJ944DRAFT_265509 [Cunninghamella echinulata]